MNVIFLSGNISDEEYVAETKRLKIEIEKAKQEEKEVNTSNIAAIKQLLDVDLLATYDSMKKEDQRRLWRSLIEEIYIEGTEATGVKPRL